MKKLILTAAFTCVGMIAVSAQMTTQKPVNKNNQTSTQTQTQSTAQSEADAAAQSTDASTLNTSARVGDSSVTVHPSTEFSGDAVKDAAKPNEATKEDKKSKKKKSK